MAQLVAELRYAELLERRGDRCHVFDLSVCDWTDNPNELLRRIAHVVWFEEFGDDVLLKVREHLNDSELSFRLLDALWECVREYDNDDEDFY